MKIGKPGAKPTATKIFLVLSLPPVTQDDTVGTSFEVGGKGCNKSHPETIPLLTTSHGPFQESPHYAAT